VAIYNRAQHKQVANMGLLSLRSLRGPLIIT